MRVASRPLVAWAGFVVAMAVQLIAVYTPGSADTVPFPVPHADKVVHFLIFALPTMFACLLPRWRGLLLVIILVNAPLSEIVQGALLPNRDADLLDLVADLTGVVVGFLLVRGARRHDPSFLAQS